MLASERYMSEVRIGSSLIEDKLTNSDGQTSELLG